jgi:drug/metabolite transporter (DMT)-like permease
MVSLLGLLAGLLWAVADVLGGENSKKIGVINTITLGQWIGFAALSVIMLLTQSLHTEWKAAPSMVWGAVIGAVPLNLAATGCLLRGLKTGLAGVVLAIASTYGGVSTILSLMSGARMSELDLVGISATVAGICLVMSGQSSLNRGEMGRRSWRGSLGWAGLSALGFGTGFWLQGAIVSTYLGRVLPLWIYYTIGSCVFLIWKLLKRRKIKNLNLSTLLFVMASAVSSLLAYVALFLAMDKESSAIAIVLSSLSGVFGAVYARVFLKQKLARSQWSGVVLTAVGVSILEMRVG